MCAAPIHLAYHRNGIGGAPFWAIIFQDGDSRKFAVLFEAADHCAVFDLGKLAIGDIAFGSNSWRGDWHEADLRDIVLAAEERSSHAVPVPAWLPHPSSDEPDVHDLLRHQRRVAVIWSTEDVQAVRPDLRADQAWEVLQECERRHDCECGFDWFLLEAVADDLFPKRAE